jgi:fructose/tagatose bisphosphate aldolase
MKSSASKIPDKITADEIKQAFRDNLHSGLGRLERFATKNDFYLALALTVRDRLFERTVDGEVGNKKVYDPRSYLTVVENAMAERVKQAASGLRAGGKTMFAS